MKKSIKPQFIINNERIIERRVIANEFNKYFVSLASKLNEKATPVTNNFGDFLPSGNMQSMFMEGCKLGENNQVLIRWIPAHSGYLGNEKLTLLLKEEPITQMQLCSSCRFPR